MPVAGHGLMALGRFRATLGNIIIVIRMSE
jgi:hypothetical protein